MKRQVGFLGKQLLAYSLALVLFLLTLVGIVYSYVTRTSRENAIINQEQMTAVTLEQVNSYFDQLMLLAAQISHDSEVVQILADRWANPVEFASNYFSGDSWEKERLLEILENHNRAKKPAQSMFLFNWNGDFLCTDPTAEKLEAGMQTFTLGYYRELINFAFSDPYRDHMLLYPRDNPLEADDPARYNILLMPIRDTADGKILGHVGIIQPFVELEALLEIDERTGISAYLVDYFMGKSIFQFYPSADSKAPSPAPYYGDILADDGIFATEAKTNYAWTVALVQNQDHLLAPYRTAVAYLLLGVVALVAALYLSVYIIAKRTNRPILQLSEKVQHLNLDGSTDRTVTAQATDEVRKLDQTVDAMIGRMRSAVALEKKAYLNALQAQMKPHFLYNCLSTISGMYIVGKADRIPKFCSRLAAILRYESTYDDKAITLDDELKNVTDYLELMKLRYEQDFTYTLQVADELRTLPMPRLTLQPLVENCFEHGFRNVAPPWHIHIDISQLDSHWCIQVRDNGCGISEEKREAILTQVEEMAVNLHQSYTDLQIGGLGLVNTIMRLRLLTEDRLTYEITSATPTGTTVTLKGALG